jgi:hypothetical protein
MDGFNGAKAIGIVVGGMPLAIAIVSTLLIVGWLAGAAKLTM